jgi:hypothetical protein
MSSSAQTQEALQCLLHSSSETKKILIAVQSRVSSPNRTPLDIVCVLDTSGSMSNKATVQNANGEVESHGLNYLDVVIHATRTIVALLSPQDRMSIITFNSNSKTIFKPQFMTDHAKADANAELDKVGYGGTTKMLGGINLGLDTMDRLQNKEGRLQSLFLFTDGMPDESPAEFETNLNRRREKYPNKRLPCTIEAFGFGYSMNSKLLDTISQIGYGHYSFIPDSGMVGTVFVNSVSNLLVSQATQCHLRLSRTSSKKPSQDDVTIQLPTICNQQPFTYMFDISEVSQLLTADTIYYTLSFNDVTNGYSTVEGVVSSGSVSPELEMFSSSIDGLTFDQLLMYSNLHTSFIEGLAKCLQLSNTDASQGVLDSLDALFESGDDVISLSKLLQGTVAELRDQVSKALLNPDWFQKWGRHYLLSLKAAHFGHCCNNFKDPGLQSFGGPLFQTIRDEADDIFVSLPAPKPKSGTTREPVDMSTYHCAYGGCFTGGSIVAMHDGSSKRVDQVMVGDSVLTAEGTAASVKLVVEITAVHGKMDLVTLNDGLHITPFHPVVHNGEWVFPCTLVSPITTECERVFDFVLDQDHSMVIGDVACVTLAHGKTDNDVVAHEFFGTERVLGALSKCDDYGTGHVVIPSTALTRNPSSNLIDNLTVDVQTSLSVRA